MVEPLVVALRHGPFWNVTYVVGLAGGEAIVVDPAWDVPAIVAAAAAHEMRISAALVTHGHHDHAHGLGELAALTGARTFAHALDLPLLDEPVPALDGAVEVTDLSARIIHTPGHTPGSVCIVLGSNVFTGDTLNVTGAGRHGHEAAAAGQLAESIRRLRESLPGSTLVWPGHDLGPAPSVRLENIPHRV